MNAPAHLSLLEYSNETVQFFEVALNTIKFCKAGQHIYFNLKNVEYITPDAVMYLIAVVNNVRRAKAMRIHCEGNMPDNEQARALIEKSGFYSYVKALSLSKSLPANNQTQILCGNMVNCKLAGEICDFVISNMTVSRMKTKRLYSMLIELMTNTTQHAYRETHGVMDERWYLYAESRDDSVSFVFLDTGAGIPSTIRTNFAERITQFFLSNKGDAKLIASALNGAFRTETGEKHRGKGLPDIFESAKHGTISDLCIIAGRGECIVSAENEIIEKTMNSWFEGTLFSWKYTKGL